MSPNDKPTALSVAGSIFMYTHEYAKAKDHYEMLIQQRPEDVGSTEQPGVPAGRAC
ncbi:MAG: hypothetical protein QM813_05990 [Verrucomicrobiota bacterium]